MRRTKIICTIGPASESLDMLEHLTKEGMNIARLNFSHGDYEEHRARVDIINELNKKLDIPIATMLDTQGPEIRLGIFKEKANLKDGAEILLTTKDIPCNEKIIAVSYKKMHEIVKPDSFIYIADGVIELKVKQVIGSDIVCEVSVGGEVSTKKNVNIPGAIIDLPSISEKDVQDIKWGAVNKVDFIAQSFVKTPKDVIDMKELLDDCGSDAHVIAKIECLEAVMNIDDIIRVADGIMIARGDLGVQIPIEEVPKVQKMIIKKCNDEGKPVIVATQMLDSMIKNPRPTRAEVTDVANAVLDGADAVMLSGETASGKYPLRAVEIMAKVIEQSEEKIDFAGLRKRMKTLEIEDAISRSVCQTAYDLNAAAILTCTSSGHTARVISRYRPTNLIIAITPNEREIKKLNLCWGVAPYHMDHANEVDKIFENAIKSACRHKVISAGDTIVLTAGIPFHIAGNINTMKVQTVEECEE